MLRTLSLRAPLALLAACLFAVGCAESASSVPSSNNPPGTNNNDPPSTPPADSKLTHVEPCDSSLPTCTMPLQIGEHVEIAVRLVDGQNRPVNNAVVKFEMITPVEAQGTALTAANVVTNSDGVARTRVNAGADPATGVGTAQIVASVADDAVNKLRFTIAVSSKDASSYEVQFVHRGQARFDLVDALLFEPSLTCAQIVAHFEQTNSLPTAEYTRRGTVDADGTIYPVVFPNLRNGESFTVAGKGFAASNENVELVFGCADGNPAIEHGVPVRVEVELIDHVPYLQGVYSVNHAFDLRDALPENVRRVVDLIGRLTTDPGSFIIGCPASSNNCPPGGAEGLVDIVFDFVPEGQIRDALNSVLNNNFVRDTIRGALNDLIDGLLDNAPAWVRNGVDITGDIYETLRQFRVEGRIVILQPPTVAIDGTEVVGLLPENGGRQVWNTVVLNWSRGCEGQGPSCSEFRVSANALGSNATAVEGSFDGAIYGSNKFEINQHSLTLNYGVLLMAIVEKVVLPAMFGPQIDSLDALIADLVNCESLAGRVGDPGSALYNATKTMCDSVLSQLSRTVRDYVASNLVFDGEDHFLIGTPAGEPCTIYQPDSYGSSWPVAPLPYVQSFGKAEPADMHCKWDAQIRFTESGGVTHMRGTFYGERDRFN